MADLAELEIRIKTLEVENASRKLVELEKVSDRAEQSTEKLGRTSVNTEKRASLLTRAIDRYQQILGRVAAITAVVVAVTATAFVGGRVLTEFETGLVGVQKTTDLSIGALEEYGDQIIALSLKIPVATSELLALSQAAGQLGVRGTQNLLLFAETIAKLGTASDLQGEQAALTLTRMLTIAGESASSIGTLATVIVRLGNEMAATESEIAGVAIRVAQATAAFKVSSAEAAALGAAYKAVGTEAELAGTATGRILFVFQDAIREQSATLDLLSQITGRTREEFQQLFEASPSTALLEFLRGLGEQGAFASVSLAQLGLDEIRTRNAILPLAANIGVLESALGTMNDELRTQNALNQEFERASQTIDGRVKILGNTFRAIGLRIRDSRGEFADLIDVVSNTVAELGGVRDKSEEASTTTLVLSGAVRTLAAAGAILISLKIVTALTGWIFAVDGLTAAVTALSAAMARNPIGLLVFGLTAAIAGLVGFEPLLERSTRGLKDNGEAWEDLSDSVEGFAEARNKVTRALIAGDTAEEISGLTTQIELLKKASESTFSGRQIGTGDLNALGIDPRFLRDDAIDALGRAVLTPDFAGKQADIWRRALEGGLIQGLEVDPSFWDNVGLGSGGLVQQFNDRMREILSRDGLALTPDLGLEEFRSAFLETVNSFIADGTDITFGITPETARDAIERRIAVLQQALDEAKVKLEEAQGGFGNTFSVERLGAFDDLADNLRLELSLLGKTNEERDKAITLAQLLRDVDIESLNSKERADLQVAVDEVSALFDRLTKEQKLEQLSRDLSNAIVQPLEEAILAGKSLEATLESIYKNVSAALLRNLVTQPLTNALSSFFFSAGLPFLGPRAEGGMINDPGIVLTRKGFHTIAENEPELVVPRSHIAAATTERSHGPASKSGPAAMHFHFHGIRDSRDLGRSSRMVANRVKSSLEG